MATGMVRYEVSGATGEQLAKRMFKLAWDACGGPQGLGFLQDRGSAVTEDQVWERAVGAGDYSGTFSAKKGQAYGDYVFGRMMKLYFEFGDSFVQGGNGAWRRDYQSFCGKYPNFQSLAKAAAKSLGVKIIDPMDDINDGGPDNPAQFSNDNA